MVETARLMEGLTVPNIKRKTFRNHLFIIKKLFCSYIFILLFFIIIYFITERIWYVWNCSILVGSLFYVHI